jgi:hypothetical protein
MADNIFGQQPFGDMDLTGFSVQAADGGFGTVDDVHLAAPGYVVVDASDTTLMVPGAVIDWVDPDAKTVFLNRSKDEIMNAPQSDQQSFEDADYQGELTRYYGLTNRAFGGFDFPIFGQRKVSEEEAEETEKEIQKER